ncbi:MAG: DMT family transporter [Granulosicoccus sp.]
MNKSVAGWCNGFLGMLIFSASLPATRLAVMDFDPMFLTVARASIAGLAGLSVLAILRVKRPGREDALSLFIIAIGVVVGFPLLTALALQHITAAHSVVFIALLPLATALFGVLRAGERPTLAFWIFSLIGSAIVAGYALFNDANASLVGDSFMLAAIIVCGLGYAEGAKLSRKLGGWQVICWALVLSLPVMLSGSVILMPATFSDIGIPAWSGLAYVSLFSMLIGFIFWYRGLAQGGIAAVGQLQLLQPFFGLLLAAVVLNEAVSVVMIGTAVLVVLCVLGARRMA